ncbi:MAG: hypothetical protein IH851_03230 [Armatimonadetes bacterium]|nr:hypothetical protein [Armatimonadota bacterium]
MRFGRTISWLMLLSPILFLGWIAVSARVSNLSTPPHRSEPAGFRERLEAHIPFVQAARRLGDMDNSDPLDPEHLSILHQALEELRNPLPPVECTQYGVGYREDVRRPIFEAQEVTLNRAQRATEALIRAGRFDEATETAVGYTRAAWTMRYADFSAHAFSNTRLVSAGKLLAQVLPMLDAHRLAWVSDALIALEASRTSVATIMRRDLDLLARNLLPGGDISNTEQVTLIAADALKAFKEGKPLQPLLQRVSLWSRSPQRDRLWMMLAEWELATRHEAANQRQLRSLIVDVRWLELVVAERDPNRFYRLGIPSYALTDPSTGRPATLEVSETGARLLFSTESTVRLFPSDDVVAVRR